MIGERRTPCHATMFHNGMTLLLQIISPVLGDGLCDSRPEIHTQIVVLHQRCDTVDRDT